MASDYFWEKNPVVMVMLMIRNPPIKHEMLV